MVDNRMVMVPWLFAGVEMWAMLVIDSVDDMRGAGEYSEDEWV
jgi:hypothetical protein